MGDHAADGAAAVAAADGSEYFEQLYDYINRHDVVHWTGQQIFDWYATQVPKAKSF